MKGETRKLMALAMCGSLIAVAFAGCGGSTSSSSQLPATTTKIEENAVPLADTPEVLQTEEQQEEAVQEQPVAEPTGAEESVAQEQPAVESTGLEEVVSGEAPVSVGSEPVSAVSAGSNVDGNAEVSVDTSNTANGYVLINYIGQTDKTLKLIISGPDGVNYTYNITKKGSYESFPLSGGNGSYTASIYKNVTGSEYSTVYSKTFSVSLANEFAPFLNPNQYVDYSNSPQAVALAAELTAGKATDLDKVTAVYDWVIQNISYNYQLAQSVQSGYLPVLDSVLNNRTGICFDYAALMAGMLRSQGVPCKLVVGYSGSAYHAWINTYTNESGWIDGVIYFDGGAWKLMDPTFASSGNQSEAVMTYIGDGANYTAKYLY